MQNVALAIAEIVIGIFWCVVIIAAFLTAVEWTLHLVLWLFDSTPHTAGCILQILRI